MGVDPRVGAAEDSAVAALPVPVRSRNTGRARSSAGQSIGLLSRGSQVRVLAGAPFPKEIADSVFRKNARRMSGEKSDRLRKFAPELACSISRAIPRIPRSPAKSIAHLDNKILGHTCRGSLDDQRPRWHRARAIAWVNCASCGVRSGFLNKHAPRFWTSRWKRSGPGTADDARFQPQRFRRPGRLSLTMLDRPSF